MSAIIKLSVDLSVFKNKILNLKYYFVSKYIAIKQIKDKKKRQKAKIIHDRLYNLWYQKFDQKFGRVPGLFTSVRFKKISFIEQRYAIVLAIPGYDELILGHIIKSLITTHLSLDYNAIACAVLNDKGVELDNKQCTYTNNKVIRIFFVDSIIYDDTECSLVLHNNTSQIKLSMVKYMSLISIVLDYLKNIIK